MTRWSLLAGAMLGLGACAPPATTIATHPGRPAGSPSAPLGGPSNIQPGQYRTTVTIVSISAPGISPQQIEAMQAEPMTDEDCVNNSDINDLARRNLIQEGEGETCADNHMTASSGHIEGAATCTNSDGDTRTMQVTGSFTATHVDMDATMTGHTSRGPESQHVRMTADRIGECPAAPAGAP